MTRRKFQGGVYTPPFLVAQILDLADYRGERVLERHVLENSCGDGAFLSEVVDRYCRAAIDRGVARDVLKTQLETYLHGIELDRDELRRCVERLDSVALEYGLSGVNWDANCGDALATSKYDGKMAFVVGNPPYVRVHNFGANHDAFKSMSFMNDGMTDLYLAFYEIGVRALAPGGTLGYITPSSFFTSVAGTALRETLIKRNLLCKIVDLRHYQPFGAVATYTTIVVLRGSDEPRTVEYGLYDADARDYRWIERLTPSEFYLDGKFYFGARETTALLRDILTNVARADLEVKNGFATLCDDVFVGDFDFQSQYVIPVVKASRGIEQKIIFPYDESFKPISEEVLKRDEALYAHLLARRERLLARSRGDEIDRIWYAYGRRQGLADIRRDKLAIGALVRDVDDLKLTPAPSGWGVYGGLYALPSNVPVSTIVSALRREEFVRYVAALGKYKNNGYYAFSSKDVKRYLDYALTRDRKNDSSRASLNNCDLAVYYNGATRPCEPPARDARKENFTPRREYLKMKLTTELRPGIDQVGYVDYNVRDFHSYDTRLGATYNAYLIRDEKTALIDTVKAPFASQLKRNVASLTSLDKVDYLVCLHSELDHAGALPEMVAACPNATVVCNAKCREMLAGFFDVSNWKFQIVQPGESLSLGKRSLTFVNVPMVHWPESSIAYMPEEKILFSNDAFGQHIATSERFDDECDLPKLLEEAKSYYANIVAPYGKQTMKALETAATLDIELIAPAHGVMWRSHIADIVKAYPDWATGKYAPKVLVIYDTMWQSTEIMAEEIYAGAVEYGKSLTRGADERPLDVQLMHARKTTLTRIAAEALDAAAVAFGSPTLNAHLMPQLGAVLDYFQGLKFREKTALAFGSFGWGVGGPEAIQKRLEVLKYPAITEAPIKAKQRPTAEVLQQCREAGAALAKAAWERYQGDRR